MIVQPRELTKEEVEKFGLFYYGGEEIPFVFQTTARVFANFTDDYSSDPVYRFYTAGTNDLRILRYFNGVWEEVELDDIPVYSIFWKLLVNLQQEFDRWVF